ncbi:MAG: MCE family protein [Bacteroidaceae bacterium]|nr:MCE family protein [Bacteroidaceae bacterium]
MKPITKEIKIAIVAICTIALLIYGINFLKGINIFQSSNLYYVAFNDISGLAKSNPVYANGYRIGIVRTIDYDYEHPGKMVYVGVDVEENMHITEGSYAELDAQMLGGVTMNIVLGQSPRALNPGDTIPGGKHLGTLDQAATLVPYMHDMMPRIDSILYGVNAIVNNPALQQTLANAAALTQELRTTTATLNNLMAGDVTKMTANLVPITNDMRSIADKLDKIDYAGTINSVNQTLLSVQETTQRLNNNLSTTMNALNSPNSTLGLLLHDRTLYDNLNRSLMSTDTLLNNLREHPKRYVHFSIFGKKDK